MAPIRYSLHYEDYSEHLMSRFGKLLQMQSLVDMTLMCSSHTLRVHKAVLAASSAYFQEVLQKQMGEPLIILKMRFGVLKCLVEFMYCGKTQCLEENLDELVSAAQFLKIKGLSKVTKEGLGITNSGELPIFTPPVVINRPPQSLIDLHAQESELKSANSTQLPPATTPGPQHDGFGRPTKDTVVRIPFDIENGSSPSNVDYPELTRTIKPRRGRPSVRRLGGWEGPPGSLGRAAERALLRREQDSRKAIHQLKHLQIRHMQNYMDRVTLSQAVSSICGPETSNNYMNMESDLMYMDQNVGANVLDPNSSYGKDTSLSDMPSNYPNTSTTNTNSEAGSDGINTAMSQYVNALKNAGLPTDLPILFESGDGSYINVNEQVLLDMVQSSEIQYEVIEQPNIIEKVADPSEIKSIDDLSKSIERGEMLLGNKSYPPSSDYTKDSSHYNQAEDTMNGLNNILPDNLESFADQQNYVVLDSRLQDNNNSLDHVGSNDFPCIDGDMQFFTKSMSDDVKKYYEDQQLSDARVMEQLCPTSSSLDTNFNMSLLDGKNSQLSDNLNQQYNPLNPEDMRRNEDCYDFSLQLPQSNVFKEDLDCLIATPRRNDDDGNSFEMNSQLDRERAQAKEEIIKDLMSIESKINMAQQSSTNENVDNSSQKSNMQEFSLDVDMLNENENSEVSEDTHKSADLPPISSSLHWDGLDINDEPCRNDSRNDNQAIEDNHVDALTSEEDFSRSVIDLMGSSHSDKWDDEQVNNSLNKENDSSAANQDGFSTDLENDIPYAVGLLPMKRSAQTEEGSLLKRKCSKDIDLLASVDSKCLKRRAKKKL